MASMDELDAVIQARLSGTPQASLRTLAGTLYRRQAGGTINYVGTIGNMGQIGTVLLTVHVGTLHKVDRVGTLDEVTTIGTLNRVSGGRIGSIGRIGTVQYAPRVGSIGHLGSQSYVGSVNRIGGGRIGSIGRIGTVNRLEGAGTLMTDQRGRRYDAAGARGTTPRLGCGSTWAGSWQHVGSYMTKTFMAKLDGTAAAGKGSIIIIGGMHGTGENDGTFTYYKGGIGKGSADTASFTEAMRYAKPKIRQHGGPAGSWQTESGGTVQARWGFQV